MNLIRFAINRKTLISMLFLGLSLLGVVSYRQLPVEMMPDVEFPFLIVMVNCQQEINPEYLEKQAIIPLEGAIGALEGVSSIESNAEGQRGMIYIYLNQGVNVEYSYLKLSERINATSLPEEFYVRTIKIDPERMSNMFMRLQVRGGGGLERVRAIIDKSILRELENIEGVSNVEVVGGRMKSMEIILDEEAARAYDITPGKINSLIAQNNRQKTFVGHAYEKQKHYYVNLRADYTDIRELENIIVDSDGPVLLKDIATVVFGSQEETSLSRVNGKDAVTVQLVRDASVNLISLSHTAREEVARLNRELAPQDIEIVVQSDNAEEMEETINMIKQLAILGSILAVIILWFFIRNVRLVVTVLLAIPVSILVAFNLFYAFDLTLNSLSLVGMALAVGMLLDNSIVVLENIYRHISHGKDRTTAVLVGTQEVWRSITASTFTTVAVFIPFIFASNFLVKSIGRQIGISIVSTLLVSLVAALLLIPMIIHGLLRTADRKGLSFGKVSQKNRLVQVYTLLLKSAIRFPVRTILSIVVVFFISLAACLAMSLDVAREVELTEFNLYVTMPRGSTLEQADKVVADLEGRIDDIEEIQDVVSTIYEEEANLTVVLKEDYGEIDNRMIPEIKKLVQQRSEGIRSAEVSMTEPQASRRYGGGMGGNPSNALSRMFGIGTQSEKVVIKGNDFTLLKKVADDIEFYLDELTSVDRAERNVSGNQPEIHLLFDNSLMSYNDIPVTSVASELASFRNEVNSQMKFKQGEDEYDIIIRNGTLEENKTYEDLRTLRIPNQASATFELEQLSRIIYASGMSSINRFNQEKQIEVTYRFDSEVNESRSLLDVSRQEVDQLIATLSIPPGVAVEVVHDEIDLSDYYFLFATAVILIYMILASVFESLAAPFVIMFTIPLAFIGSLWALTLTGNSLLHTNSLTGFLILIGVVVNNGIILIDYTGILRKRGYRRSRALMEAGQARIRPILITAITTIVAMMPLAMGKAEYVAYLGAPFAIAVIGGLALSTLFTLVFIPTVYSGMETALAWLRGLDWRIKLVQFAGFAACCTFIYYNVDSLLWRVVWLLLTLAAIPGLTWFIINSHPAL
ncbi:efflux RND transporter permease subunit, partial [Gemmatimonadota bacterium]